MNALVCALRRDLCLLLILGASALQIVTNARCSADNSLYPTTIMLTDAKVLQTFIQRAR